MGLHETHPLFAACRHPAVQQRLCGCAKSKNAKVSLVYQHELPNVPGKSIKGVLLEYGPGSYSPGHCLLYGRFGGKRTLSRQRAIPIYECTA